MTQVKNIIKDNYNLMLLNDFLRERIKEAGFEKVEITKTPTGTKVTLYVTRPGIVIGRKGVGIKELTEKLENDFKLKNTQISVEEISRPELSSNVMCNRMASYIQRGTAFRRATMWTLQQIMEKGAMGVQITVSGKLRGDRSAFEKHSAGILPRAGQYAKNIVDEDIAHVETPMGLIGIKIRIAKKEKVIPEFELKDSTGKPILKDKIEPEKDKIEPEKDKIEPEKETSETKPRTESEQIQIDQEKIQKIETLEEEEEKLK
jgi:small subunit ribosomal protein S3